MTDSNSKDVQSVLVIGSGPIVIGQSAEFDYSGTQACLALREAGIRTILINPNPATIQTDKQIADVVYIEPLLPEIIENIITTEKPDAILPTVGGQTALNLAVELDKRGILEQHNIRVIGTNIESIQLGESRELFSKKMNEIKIPILKSKTVKTIEEGLKVANDIGYPIIIRPAFTLGGTGGGIANNETELKKILSVALSMSKTSKALIEISIYGWGEFEYEIVRDKNGNTIVICNMENVDPMGIHTGDSIVVAPSQTLSDEDHQRLRDASIKIVNALNIVGSCNVQFSFNHKTKEFYVIEVNPRLSRSSALASKATGYPIARIATKIAIGKTLDKLRNPIIGNASASMEPTLDYIVVKIPRFPFDKFREVSRKLGTQMKSTGEVMAIGRTFSEALYKALRGLDIKEPKLKNKTDVDLKRLIEEPNDLRIFAILEALNRNWSVERISKLSYIHKWFIQKLNESVKLKEKARVKDNAFTILQANRINKVYKIVDSCAGEFEARTPYFYSTNETENEAKPLDGKKVIIIGSGPIRIGQGIEFDYCCTQAAMSLKKRNIKSIMINNNPETLSTDFDSSDRLYFEPLTFEDVLNIVKNEKMGGNLLGVIVQLGGQTSIKLANKLANAGIKILGTSVDSIDMAEDRDKFRELMNRLNIPQPESETSINKNEAIQIAKRIGYPIIIRPSYVIAGRGMRIVFSEEDFKKYIDEAVDVSEEKPVLIDKYLENAYECEVDAVSDGKNIFIGGVMEHIEYAGVHSGDANIVLPTLNLNYKTVEKIKDYTRKIARALNVRGLLNIQFAVKDNVVYMIEANPRASRTIPFVSKATDVNIIDLAMDAMLGKTIPDEDKNILHYAVKSPVFPFSKLPEAIHSLGPEMKSTGEAMGLGTKFETAYFKALLSSGIKIPKGGSVLITLNKGDKEKGIPIAEKLSKLGFKLYSTPGTGAVLRNVDNVILVDKIQSKHRDIYQNNKSKEFKESDESKESEDILSIISSGKVDLVINTPAIDENAIDDGYMIRYMSAKYGIPCIMNMRTAREFVDALEKYILSGETLNLEIKRSWKYGE